MPTPEAEEPHDDSAPSRSDAVRHILGAARAGQDPTIIQAALIGVCEALAAQAELQQRSIDDLRVRLDRDVPIVAVRPGGEPHASTGSDGLREFASSSNGDRWYLGRDDATGIAHVVHKANDPSGGAVTSIELGAFLNRGPSAPEMLGLLRLIGSLVA